MLSADPAEEALLTRHLEEKDHGKHELKLVASLEALKTIELESTCHAILLDIRAGYTEAMEAIRWIGEPQSSVALICLCRDHEQLNCYKSVMHLIDDYILANTLPDGELSVRISHAMAKSYSRDVDNIIGTMGISRDISDLKRVQDHLTEEHRLLSTILNNVPDRVFAKDREGRYIASNRLHLKFLGLEDEEDVLGTTLYEHVAKEQADKYFKEDMEIMRTGIGLINSEESRIKQDGSTVWYLTSKVPLIDETGRCVGLVGISRDVTEQKENEKKLWKTIEVLKETQLQLIEAEKLKTVGRLAAGVAHEVKNPLNVVSLGTEYLQSQIDEPPDLVEIITDMRQAVGKANAVISQLLDYSSPHELTAEPNDLNTIIQEVIAMMRHNFNEAHIKVETELAPDLPRVAVDPQKMDQVFINLFLNAISAMKKGGQLSVRTDTQRMKSTGSNVSSELTEIFNVGETMVTVVINDSGHGISRKSADKLFDPFYSTKSTGEGNGLGLSVTRSIVEMHRGMITLNNRADHPGACAKLYFPISPDSYA